MNEALKLADSFSITVKVSFLEKELSGSPRFVSWLYQLTYQKGHRKYWHLCSLICCDMGDSDLEGCAEDAKCLYWCLAQSECSTKMGHFGYHFVIDIKGWETMKRGERKGQAVQPAVRGTGRTQEGLYLSVHKEVSLDFQGHVWLHSPISFGPRYDELQVL